MQPDINEALRYLGVRGEPDEALRSQLALLSAQLSSRITPRSTWAVFPITYHENQHLMGGIVLPGRSAARMLADCRQCAALVCTLGTPFDTWLRQLQHRDMAQAVLLDALGSAYIEAACDAVEREIAQCFPKQYPTDRFSPGYGDLPLALQPQLLAAVQAHRIGVTLTPSNLMLPQKSVSALIGLADVPQAARIRGCAFCAMNKTCTLRKAGMTCEP